MEGKGGAGMSEQVVLVNARDEDIGVAEKLHAHVEPQLHRAFSIFLFNRAGELLLQRRAASKYHSAGLWSNTCCGHPRPGEHVAAAASRRLAEEMGIACTLERGPRFIYRAVIDAQLTEYELDHLFTGRFDGAPVPDPAEVALWRWVATADIERELRAHPTHFTVWFAEAFSLVRSLAPPRAHGGIHAGSNTPALR